MRFYRADVLKRRRCGLDFLRGTFDGDASSRGVLARKAVLPCVTEVRDDQSKELCASAVKRIEQGLKLLEIIIDAVV